MNDERDKIQDEMEALERNAYEIVKSLVRNNYSFSSMLYFASRIQWLVFNVELIINEVKCEDERKDEILKEFVRSRNE